MTKGIRFFILAHPDDEIMALPLLYDKKYHNKILYLTVDKNNSRFSEAQEAVGYLKTQGLEIDLVVNSNPSVDGLVHLDWTKDRLLECAKLVKQFHPDEIVSTHYEGGHQDHDTAFVIGFLLSKILDTAFISFSTYRKSQVIFPNFVTMKAITGSNSFEFERLIVAYATLRLIRIYRSQWKTWVGLGPFVIFRYLGGKTNFIADVKNLDSIQVSNTFYEYRNRAKTDSVIEKHNELLSLFSYRRLR